MLPRLDAERLPDDIPLVVFHAMVRVHVPAERRAAFDAAIAALGGRRRVLPVSLEIPPRDSPHDRSAPLLALRDSRGADRDHARTEGHGRWIQPLS
jgi:hypothetical protein